MKFGTEEQKNKYLRRLATGEDSWRVLFDGAGGRFGCGGNSGARCGHGKGRGRAGSPIISSARVHACGGRGLERSAIRHAGRRRYRLNGTKTWVSNGHVAGLFIVFAKTDPEAGGKGISAFLVEPGFPGFKVGRHEDKMGQRSTPAVEILLNDCEVPRENRLGEEGQGLKIALSALDGGRIGIAAQALGLAQGALDESVKHAKARRAFGKIDWRVPGDSVDAGGHADGDRGGARAGLSRGVA